MLILNALRLNVLQLPLIKEVMKKKLLYILILVIIALGAFLFIKHREELYDGIITCVWPIEDEEGPVPELAEWEIDNVPSFNGYPVQEKYFVPVALDIDSNPRGALFKTKISEGYVEDQPNFAGKYTIVSWGCGVDCFGWVIINNATGQIFGDYMSEKLTDGGSSYGMDFNIDSNLIIINPSQESDPEYFKDMDDYIKNDLNGRKDLYPTKYFKWENNELIPVESTP
jgi:hypothetical protein